MLEQIEKAASHFPKFFGLRSFPGDVFCISLGASFVSNQTVMLYAYVKRDNRWLAFSKGTVPELQAQVVALPENVIEETTKWDADRIAAINARG